MFVSIPRDHKPGGIKEQEFEDLLGGPVAKTPHFQCRGPGFDPWSGI